MILKTLFMNLIYYYFRDDYDLAWECMFKFGSWTFDGFNVDVDFYEGKK